MNKVYLSGIISQPPTRTTVEGVPIHAEFALSVNHKTKTGHIKREQYPIHAWNGVAEWALRNLRVGQRVTVQGYLTQHRCGGAIHAAVTAEEFFPASFAPAAEYGA